ncbi:MAG: HAD family hydrolase [Clostridia bacterium]|nr:HAD family hydrolase [Clostridia bacterium]
MKKLLCLICIILICVVPIDAFAEQFNIAAKATSDKVKVTESVTITLETQNTTTQFTAAEIKVENNNYFKVISGKFLGEDSENAAFNPTLLSGKINYTEPQTANSNLFSLVLQAEKLTPKATEIKIEFNLFNNETPVATQNLTVKILTECTEHSFGKWTNEFGRTPDCETGGNATRTCVFCGFSETKNLEQGEHKFGESTIIKAPTCTEIGYSRAFCGECGDKILTEVAATGHTLGNKITTTAPTCTETGILTAKCNNCEYFEEYPAAALGHKFSEAVITTEPTISTNGIQTGVCVRCNKTTDSPVDCAQYDATNNIQFNTKLGVFPEGTVLKINNITNQNEGVRKALEHISSVYTAFNISSVYRLSAPEPNGDLTATFSIPAEYGKNAALYFISNDGSISKLTSQISPDGLTITTKIKQMGIYAVCNVGIINTTAGGVFKLNGIFLAVLALILIICVWLFIGLKVFRNKILNILNNIKKWLIKNLTIKKIKANFKFLVKNIPLLFKGKSEFKSPHLRLENPNEYKAVVFDLDHTLFDRWATYSKILDTDIAYSVFKKELGKKKILKAWIFADKHYNYISWERMWEYLKKKGVIIDTVERENFFENHIKKLFMEVAVPYDFTIPTLEKLKEKGYKIGLITNGSNKLQRTKLKTLGLNDIFDAVIISDNYGIRKPNRLLFYKMAELMKIPPEHMLYVGDHPLNDIDASRQAGYTPVWVKTKGRWQFNNIEKCELQVKNISQILKILNIQ